MVRRILVVVAAAGNVDRLLVCPHNLQAGGSRVNYEDGTRTERGCERLIARDFGFGDGGELTGK
jgi:hypothetical protein